MAWKNTEAKRFPGGLTGWFENWSEDGTYITVPLSTFPELGIDEADAEAGDTRKVLYAICEKCWQQWNGLDPVNKPTKMTIQKSSSTNVLTGRVTHQYSFTFVNSVSVQDVDPEP